MPKEPRPTLGVPEPVFQKELLDYLLRKENAPEGKKVKASFEYNGTSYTIERGSGVYHSGYQLKRSADQAAKEMARNQQKNAIKLSDGEKMFMQTYYDVAAERNAKEGRTGDNKIEVDHRIPRSQGGLHHPYNLGLLERKDNGKKSDKIGGQHNYLSLIEDKSPLWAEYARRTNFLDSALSNESHPMGGNVVDTDPLGGNGLPIRTP